MQVQASGSTYKEITKSRFSELQIPLPPLGVQQELVAQDKGEQALINSNCVLIDRYERRIEAVLARVWKGRTEARDELV